MPKYQPIRKGNKILYWAGSQVNRNTKNAAGIAFTMLRSGHEKKYKPLSYKMSLYLRGSLDSLAISGFGCISERVKYVCPCCDQKAEGKRVLSSSGKLRLELARERQAIREVNKASPVY